VIARLIGSKRLQAVEKIELEKSQPGIGDLCVARDLGRAEQHNVWASRTTHKARFTFNYRFGSNPRPLSLHSPVSRR
jgi:hypothetical protein